MLTFIVTTERCHVRSHDVECMTMGGNKDFERGDLRYLLLLSRVLANLSLSLSRSLSLLHKIFSKSTRRLPYRFH